MDNGQIALTRGSTNSTARANYLRYRQNLKLLVRAYSSWCNRSPTRISSLPTDSLRFLGNQRHPYCWGSTSTMRSMPTRLSAVRLVALIRRDVANRIYTNAAGRYAARSICTSVPWASGEGAVLSQPSVSVS